MTLDASILAHVRALEAYVPGKPISHVARELGLDAAGIIKLASNENALGASPAVSRAIGTAIAEVNRYPDNECYELREHLSRHLDIPFEQIILGAGSSELILLAARTLLAPGRAAVLSQYSFVSYEAAAQSVGARVITVPVHRWQPDLKSMHAAIDSTVRIVFIASPNNPTGALVEAHALESFIAAVPDDVLVVLDEAYHDFVAPQLRVDVRRLVARHSNLLVLRTFSKVYGLAGLRVGYGLGDVKIVELLRRMQPPFSVNALAQAAAIAALSDAEFVERSIAANRNGREQLCAQLEAGGFEFVAPHGNFVLLRVGDGAAVFRELLKCGIVVRPVTNYGLPGWVRVTVGLPQENAEFLRALRAILPRGTPAST